MLEMNIKKMDIGIQSKIKYCKKHNIDFILEDETADYFDKDRRYEWCKILMLKNILKIMIIYFGQMLMF